MRLFKRRKYGRLGFKFQSIKKELANIKEEVEEEGGDFDSIDSATLAADVAERIYDKNKAKFKGEAIDWDRLLDFVERIISIILKLAG